MRSAGFGHPLSSSEWLSDIDWVQESTHGHYLEVWPLLASTQNLPLNRVSINLSQKWHVAKSRTITFKRPFTMAGLLWWDTLKFVNSVKAKYTKTSKVMSSLTEQGNWFQGLTLQIIKGDTVQKHVDCENLKQVCLSGFHAKWLGISSIRQLRCRDMQVCSLWVQRLILVCSLGLKYTWDRERQYRKIRYD